MLLKLRQSSEGSVEIVDGILRRVCIAGQLFAQCRCTLRLLGGSTVGCPLYVLVDLVTKEVLEDVLALGIGGVQELGEFTLRQRDRLSELFEGQSEEGLDCPCYCPTRG